MLSSWPLDGEPFRWLLDEKLLAWLPTDDEMLFSWLLDDVLL
jgi:hypothetical protein